MSSEEFYSESLSPEQLVAIEELQKAVVMVDMEWEGVLPEGWIFHSTGGDGLKYIVSNPEQGLTLKRYMWQESSEAAMWFFEKIARVEFDPACPVLRPIARVGDALVYPYLPNIVKEYDSVNEASVVRHTIQRAGVDIEPLYIGNRVKIFELSDGRRFVTDPFDDSYNPLKDACQKHLRGK